MRLVKGATRQTFNNRALELAFQLEPVPEYEEKDYDFFLCTSVREVIDILDRMIANDYSFVGTRNYVYPPENMKREALRLFTCDVVALEEWNLLTRTLNLRETVFRLHEVEGGGITR